MMKNVILKVTYDENCNIYTYVEKCITYQKFDPSHGWGFVRQSHMRICLNV